MTEELFGYWFVSVAALGNPQRGSEDNSREVQQQGQQARQECEQGQENGVQKEVSELARIANMPSLVLSESILVVWPKDVPKPNPTLEN